MEPELAEVVRDRVFTPIRQRARADLSRIVDADNPFLELLIDIVPALVLFRTVLLGEAVVTDEFLGSILDLITTLARSPTSA
jgi:hypothetical protein